MTMMNIRTIAVLLGLGLGVGAGTGIRLAAETKTKAAPAPSTITPAPVLLTPPVAPAPPSIPPETAAKYWRSAALLNLATLELQRIQKEYQAETAALIGLCGTAHVWETRPDASIVCVSKKKEGTNPLPASPQENQP